jgi:membrane protein required for colicin V production
MMLDIAFLLLSVIAFYRGWKKGLLWGIGSFLAVFIAVLLALKLGHTLADFLFEQQILQTSYTLPISFLLIFILTLFSFRQLAKLLESVLDKLFLGWANHLLGAILYVLFVAFVFSLGIWLFNKTDLLNKNMKQEAKTYAFIEPIAPKMIEVSSAYIPFCKNLFEQINATLDRAVEHVDTQSK